MLIIQTEVVVAQRNPIEEQEVHQSMITQLGHSCPSQTDKVKPFVWWMVGGAKDLGIGLHEASRIKSCALSLIRKARALICCPDANEAFEQWPL